MRKIEQIYYFMVGNSDFDVLYLHVEIDLTP